VLNGIHVLRVSGEVDLSVKDQFERALASAVKGAHSPLVIDLTDVRYLDSMGLNALVRAKSQMVARNDELHIVLKNPHLQKVFRILGFYELFRIHESLDDALRAAAQA
jgi:anti-anti-sigma factor